MKKILLYFFFALHVTSFGQFNAPWFNDPGGIPGIYTTGDNGECRHLTYTSAVHGEDIGYWIYLPPAYMNDSISEYSIIYWLHGGSTGGLNENTLQWLSDDYIEEHSTYYANLRNSIIVYPNGLDLEMYTDQNDNSVQIETSIITELIPHIEANYSVSSDRACKGIIGFSMGGFGAVKYLFKYPQLFSHAVSVDGSLFPSLTHDPAYASDMISFPYFFNLFDNDTNHFNANNIYTWADDYFTNNSSLPVNLFVLAGQSDPLEGYHATNFVNYLSNTHSFDASFILNPSMGHDVLLFLGNDGDSIYSFQDSWICADFGGSGGSGASIDTYNNFEPFVYPNPSNDAFNLMINESASSIEVEILDITGKLVHSTKTYNTAELKLEFEGSRGVYMAHITLNEDQKAILKLFKE